MKLRVPNDDEPERQRLERYYSRAAFYGLYLRQQGYSPDHAAALVIERYPRVREQLRRSTRDSALQDLQDRRTAGGQ